MKNSLATKPNSKKLKEKKKHLIIDTLNSDDQLHFEELQNELNIAHERMNKFRDQLKLEYIRQHLGDKKAKKLVREGYGLIDVEFEDSYVFIRYWE